MSYYDEGLGAVRPSRRPTPLKRVTSRTPTPSRRVTPPGRSLPQPRDTRFDSFRQYEGFYTREYQRVANEAEQLMAEYETLYNKGMELTGKYNDLMTKLQTNIK